MIHKFKNIDTAFKQTRLFCMCVVAACIIICCFVVYKSYRFVSESQQRIYILANGKAMDVFAADQHENIPVEARDHIRTFHQYFFTLDPDDKSIQTNISKSYYLADESAKRLYDNLKEAGYYTGIISANISQSVTVDSIQLDINQYPFYFKCFATEEIVRASAKTIRVLITQGYLRRIARSDNDPHGFLIERFETLDNHDIKQTGRY